MQATTPVPSSFGIDVNITADDTLFSYTPTSVSDVQGKPRTTAVRNWTPTAWVDDEVYSTDVTTVVQELINRTDWDNITEGGHAITLFVEDSASGDDCRADSFETTSGNASRLAIQWGSASEVAGAVELSASATLSAVSVQAHIPLTAGAELSISPAITRVSTAVLNATATITAFGTTQLETGSADLDATATVSANGVEASQLKIGSAALEAGAALAADGLRQLYIDLEAGALLDIEAERLVDFVIPSTAANTVSPGLDFTDTDEFHVSVNSVVVPLGVSTIGDSHRFQFEDYATSYSGGKTVRFSEIPSVTYGQGTYAHNQIVRVYRNWGSGDEKFFQGRIREIQRHGENHAERITYVAYGQMNLASEIYVSKTYISSVTTITSGYTSQAYLSSHALNIKQAVDQLFTDYSSELTAAGIPTARDTSTLRNIWITDNLDLRGGFLQSLRQIVGRDKGATVYFNDLDARWVFPRPSESRLTTVDVSSINLMTHDVSESLAGRYTAIELREPINQTETLDMAVLAVVPDWNFAAQEDWTESKGAIPGTEHADVYRRYVYNGTGPIPAESSGYLHITREVIVGYDNIDSPGSPFGETVAVPVTESHSLTVTCKVEHQYTRVILTANNPLVFQGNSGAPGDVVGGGVTAYGGYPTKRVENSQTTFRYPGSGYTGTAYSDYGIQNVLIEAVDYGEATLMNAKERLRFFKDVVISGSLPVDGDVLRQFVELDMRLKMSHSVNTPALNDAEAHCTGYRYVFGKRSQGIIDFTTDIGAIITS
jgi:hypothetical protein